MAAVEVVVEMIQAPAAQGPVVAILRSVSISTMAT
jgi:hypothetical protein